MSAPTIGRLAPSPTGAQHVGNARTYLMAWLLCRRSNNNRMLLRIEDLETPRIKTWAIDQIYEDFQWLGIDWEPPPPTNAILFQSDRNERYHEIIQALLAQELVYPCICSRSDIELAAAPHESQLDGQIYPGTCRNNSASDALRFADQGIPFSLRFRVPPGNTTWHDQFYGNQQLNVADALGDFVLWRNDGNAAYQLAVVVDDHDSGVNQVVRGADLIYSTFRQLLVYNAFAWQPPAYTHLPLVVGTDGKRLAKRHGDTRLSTLRQLGVTSDQLIGYLAWKSGMIDKPARLQPSDLLTIDPITNLPSSAMTFDAAHDIPFMKAIT